MPPFLATLGGKVLAAALMAAVLMGVGTRIGWKIADNACKADQLASAKQAIATTQKSGEITQAVVSKHLTKKVAISESINAVRKEVDHAPSSVGCNMPARDVRMLDDAIHLRAASRPTGGPDDAATAITDADRTDYELALIEYALQVGAQLTALQEWVNAQYVLRSSEKTP